jgi:hypothetical protein
MTTGLGTSGTSAGAVVTSGGTSRSTTGGGTHTHFGIRG